MPDECTRPRHDDKKHCACYIELNEMCCYCYTPPPEDTLDKD